MNEIEFFSCATDALGYTISPEQEDSIKVNPAKKVTQIVAGPGAGKTEVLALRVVYEIMVRGVESHRIMATTFTNKAAEELTYRIANRTEQIIEIAKKKGITYTDPKVQLVRVGTMHALCDELLTEFDPSYVEAGMQLIDESNALMRLMRYSPQMKNLVRKRMERLIEKPVNKQSKLIALFRPGWEDLSWPRGDVSSYQRVKLVHDVIASTSETSIPRGVVHSGKLNGLDFQTPSTKDHTADLEKIRDGWAGILQNDHAIDFSTIQFRFWEAVRSSSSPLKGEFEHVFVDEFQDTNAIQFSIHSLWPLLTKNAHLTVVGDEDQSMYRFRGSDISCFMGLPAFCTAKGLDYELKFLQTNYRSTKAIVEFSQAFRYATGLQKYGKKAFGHDKLIRPSSTASSGPKVRAIVGSKEALAEFVAEEIAISSIFKHDDHALLMFSTMEKNESLPALIRESMESRAIKLHNPTAKMAWGAHSDMTKLFAAVLYFFDPILKKGRANFYASRPKPRGNFGGVDWSTMSLGNWDKELFTNGVCTFPCEYDASGSVKSPDFRSRRPDLWKGITTALNASEMRPIKDYLDAFRAKAVDAIDKQNKLNAKSGGKKLTAFRVTVGELIYRILSQPPFNTRLFDHSLLRQVLFTQFFEGNAASTRLTKFSLDDFIWCQKVSGKIHWPSKYWDMLKTLKEYMTGVKNITDLDQSSFERNAVKMMTFHASKGLEFPHVYVARTGREISVSSPLRTKIFSGEDIEFNVDANGQPLIVDSVQKDELTDLAKADRDREVYVALTRAEKQLTVLIMNDTDFVLDKTHEDLEDFLPKKGVKSSTSGVTIYEYDASSLLKLHLESEVVDQ